VSLVSEVPLYPTLERHGYKFKGLTGFFLNPRPDFGRGPVKRAEFTRVRKEQSLGPLSEE